VLGFAALLVVPIVANISLGGGGGGATAKGGVF